MQCDSNILRIFIQRKIILPKFWTRPNPYIHIFSVHVTGLLCKTKSKTVPITTIVTIKQASKGKNYSSSKKSLH